MSEEPVLDSTIVYEYWEFGDEESAEGPVEEMVPEMAAPPEQPAAAPQIPWQSFITWIIGSLNGIFGLILLIKKVFNK